MDGGIANNLPIDVVRKLCAADVIIAINISPPPLKRDEITSVLSVTAQLLNLLGKQTVDRQLAGLGARDVLISPDLGTISSGNFERTPEAIDIGEHCGVHVQIAHMKLSGTDSCGQADRLLAAIDAARGRGVDVHGGQLGHQPAALPAADLAV